MSAAGEGAPLVHCTGGDAATLERLAQAIAAQPDLAGLVPFWADLYRVQFAAREQLVAIRGAFAWALRSDRLLARRPQLTLGDLPLDADMLGAWVGDLAAAWGRYNPAQALPAGEDWPALVGRAFLDPTLAPGQRTQLGYAATLAFLALVPCLEWAAIGVLPALQGELATWGQGLCPVCGGYPDLAVLAGDPASRSLVCSRCSTLWPYRRVGCPFCYDVEGQVYHAGDDGTHRLYVCSQCHRYLKTVDLRSNGSRIDPWAERLLTIGMDLAALDAGYGPR